MCVHAHTCALKDSDGQYQAKERGEEGEPWHSLHSLGDTGLRLSTGQLHPGE